MTSSNMFDLGKEAHDIASGFTGIIIAQARHLGGCNKYLLVAQAKDGKAGTEEWFDENRISVTPAGEEIGTGFGYHKTEQQ